MKLIFAVCLVSLAIHGIASPEDELSAKLLDIFAKAAAHYRALEAAATPQMKDAKGQFRTPHGYNQTLGVLDMRSIHWWTSGYFPGSLWYLYEATGDEFFKNRATTWTEILAPNAKVKDYHDIGLIMYCSYGNARRLLKTDRYDGLLVETAASLASRFHPKLGLIRSWGKVDEKKNFLVIPDGIMCLELLEFAATRRNGARFGKIASSHADVTMRNHYDSEGGCHHVLDYDQETGSVKEIRPGQGLSVKTAWGRGQSWSIYGYTMMYRMTGYVRYLDFAKKLANYAMNHPNMPEDGVPCWDYGAPGEERDTSAAAIMASALVELSQYVGMPDRARYRDFAVKQLLALSSKAYFSEGNEAGHFLLKHGVGHKPGKSEIDTPLDYGDYYFLEALLRFRRLVNGENARKGIAAQLPLRPFLPADELLYRTRVRWCKLQDLKSAEMVAKEPIADTSDELYVEYWKNGNRSHYEERFMARLNNFDKLMLAEAKERKGRFLPRLADYVNAFCDMKSWILPAHDDWLGAKGVLNGRWIITDLFGSELAAHLACAVQLFGDRLGPELVRRIRREAERRVFEPMRRELPFHSCLAGGDADPLRARQHWWTECNNNWNAVCWDNVVCAALGLVDDANDRARFVDAAMKAIPYYLSGFTRDGYCSEGMGYWNFGYGHHLLMGRLLRSVSGGKIDIFTYPVQRAVSAYPRSYTLCDGISPAFSDGNGAVNKFLYPIIDEIWKDLPKEQAPVSEFPNGQVWLLRDPTGLSVAFKGGHNNEFHNHNDLGSYYVVCGSQILAGDPGGEVYTRFTFGARYRSKVLNSYGHPVPIVGGALQSTGRAAAAKVVSKDISSPIATVVLDLTAAYRVKTLKKLTRTFVYNRTAKTFAITDRVEFTKPTAFESPFNTFLSEHNPAYAKNKQEMKFAWNARPEIKVKGGEYTLVEEDIPNPELISPHRVSVRFTQPVQSAEVIFTYSAYTP